jgi:molecular chaperone HtpG
MSTETMQFQTEQKQLMEIIIHSLYSHKEVFLRELISNACDAIDKVRFESLTNADLLENNEEWKIKLIADKEKGTLTISDNGIGMNRESIIDNLGTIARSGTKAFLHNLKEAKKENTPDLIGQFGVGFYASFMVADRVVVTSRLAGDEKGNAISWESTGEGEYTLTDCNKDGRGTDITLYLREDDKEFLDEYRLRQVIKQYSDFVEHPICLDVEREEGEGEEKQKVVKEEVLNSQKALWLRNRSEVSDEEYEEFYKHISHDFQKPNRWIHYSAEGTLEFKALLYLPSKRPFEMFSSESPKSSLHLYVRRVQIVNDCDKLLPPYLRFVKGVVDSADLPLNVSREMLQHNRLLEKIQNNLVSKVLSELEKMKNNDQEEYKTLYKEFGGYIKEGINSDFTNRDRLAELLMFESTTTENGQYTTLAQYLDAMPEEQKEIFYLAGDSRATLEKSPVLEVFKARGQEVLLLTEPIDDWTVQALGKYKEKEFKAVDKGEIEANEEEKKALEEKKDAFKEFLEWANNKLEDVKDVRLTNRLSDSACCLVADESDMSAHMERVMQKIGQEDALPSSLRILEINPEHPAIKSTLELYTNDSASSEASDYLQLLYAQAVLSEGSVLKDPAEFSTRLNRILARG